MPLTPLRVLQVDVVPTVPIEGDAVFIADARTRAGRDLEPVTYIVRLQLETLPEPVGAGWALYVGDLRIPKYWQYPSGIYFTVYDPAFFDEYGGQPVRFSVDHGSTFEETGLRLGRPESQEGDQRALADRSDVLR